MAEQFISVEQCYSNVCVMQVTMHIRHALSELREVEALCENVC